MYTQSHTTSPSFSPAASKNPSRATLQTRPRIQRSLIRSWEYIPAVRATVAAIRLAVVVWMVVLTNLLVSAGQAWGWAFLPGAVAMLALTLWVFRTAAKGWPVDEG